MYICMFMYLYTYSIPGGLQRKRFSGLSLADQKEVEKLMHATNNDTNFEVARGFF